MSEEPADPEEGVAPDEEEKALPDPEETEDVDSAEDAETVSPGESSEAAAAPTGRLPRSLWMLSVGLLLGLFAGLYLLVGTTLIRATNASDEAMNGGDQRHNMKLAVVAREIRRGEGEFAQSSRLEGDLVRSLPHYTDGVVSPLWPWVASFFAPEGVEVGGPWVNEGERAFFARGKWFLLAVSCAFLAALGGLLVRFFSLPAVFLVLLLGGLGAFLPRSAYFQPEVLSYLFLTLSWIVVLLILRRNGLLGYLLLGIFLALAYLAKASIQPIVVAFLLATTWRAVEHGWRARKGLPLRGWNLVGHGLGLCLLALSFSLVAGPRMVHSQRQFGSAFHTYPSYWMWLDRFEDSFTWMQEHGDREALEADAENAPSAGRYLSEHTLGEFASRLRDGTGYVLGRFLDPPRAARGKDPPRPWKRVLERRGHYLGLLALLALTLVLLVWLAGGREGIKLSPEALGSALFVLVAFVLSALAYGWYSPIGKGDRFMLSLYLPLVLSLVWFCERLFHRLPPTALGGRIRWGYLCVQTLLCATLVWRAIEVLRFPEFE